MPKRVDLDERRRTLASAAIEVIAAEGLEGTKLSRVAAHAGVTTGALTHYFEDKDEILLAALEEVRRRLMAKADDGTGQSPLALLSEALPIDPDAAKEWRVWLAFWGRAAFVPALARVHRAYYAEIENALAAMLSIPTDAAAAIIAAIDGISARVCLEPDLWPPERQRALLALMISPHLPEGAARDASLATSAA